MVLSRRNFLVSASALGLTACVGGGGGAPAVAQSWPTVPNPGWDAWVADFRGRALAKGISPATFDGAFARSGYIPLVLEKQANQTEFKRSLEDYLSIAASDERVSKGRAALARMGGTLQAIEARYGVEPHVVTAFWGLESFYGERRGEVPVVSALSTLAFAGRRTDFFEQQLVAALKILQSGDTTPGQMVGSWAGAMGHTQFIPTSYLSLAVDFTGDGRRDIWADDPTDALASTAAYMRNAGWQQGVPWGMEVVTNGASGGARSLSGWADAGVTKAGGGRPNGSASATLIRPAGAGGPAFLITRNFNAILRYNNAESYAIGVGHLSDRLNGGPAIQGTFPPDAAGMSKVQRQRMQELLTGAGFDTGGTDGVIGDKTKAAIRAYEAARGLAVTGEPSLAVLAALGG
jgi:membrane-bound lytic murein transglycosylase B